MEAKRLAEPMRTEEAATAEAGREEAREEMEEAARLLLAVAAAADASEAGAEMEVTGWTAIRGLGAALANWTKAGMHAVNKAGSDV